jgi:hypothetical protein
MLIVGAQVVWLPLSESGAIRLSDGALWRRARKCARCGQIGYDHDDAFARIEAENLDVWTSVCVVVCCRCGRPFCVLCLDERGRCRLCAIVGRFEME